MLTANETPDSNAAESVAAKDAYAARMMNGSKVYGAGDTDVRALDDVTVGFAAGGFTAVMVLHAIATE